MSALSPAVSSLEAELRDLVELCDISVICLIQYSHKYLITKKHKAIGTWHWAVEKMIGESEKPTVTWYSSVDTITGKSEGTDC